MSTAYDIRQNIAYLNGVYVAVDAISDAYLVVDGPFCVLQKAEMQVGHHPATTLVAPAGMSRVVQTDLHLKPIPAHNVALDRGRDIVSVLSGVAAHPGAGIVLLTSMDFHQILGAPLERYRRSAGKEGGAPIALLDARSLEGDWLDGYARTLDVVARTIELPEPDPALHRVAVVGHMMDRLEGDQLGNVRELGRMLERMGLELVATWPSGVSTAELAEVHRAGLVISLPYGRAAARTLVDRLGCGLVEVDLPLGLGPSVEMLDAVGEATGRLDSSSVVAGDEATRVASSAEILVHRFLAGRRAVVQADPYVAMALAELLDDLGMEVSALHVVAEERGLDEATRDYLRDLGAVYEQGIDERPGGGLRLDEEVDADVLIAPTLFPHDPVRARWIPFGYPNYLVHPVLPRPFLGFEGVRWWVETLVEAVLRSETEGGDTQRGGTAKVRPW